MKLNKLFISIASALVLSTSAVQAQDIGLGIKVGSEVSKISGSNLKDNLKGNFLVGAQAHARFFKFGIQADVNISQTKMTTGPDFSKSFSNYIKSGSVFSETDIVLTELAVPVVFEYRFLRLFRAELGGQYSMLINAIDKNDYLTDPKELFKNTLSGVVGVKAELSKFQVGIRYVHAFTNLNATQVDEKWNNGKFQIYASYLFL